MAWKVEFSFQIKLPRTDLHGKVVLPRVRLRKDGQGLVVVQPYRRRGSKQSDDVAAQHIGREIPEVNAT